MGATNSKIAINYERMKEIDAWKKVAKKYKESPWVEKINEHIKGLQ